MRSLICNVAFALALLAAAGHAGSLENAFPHLTFSQPVFLTHAPDSTNRIVVVQQNGLIKVFPNDSSAAQASVFLDVSAKISSSTGEEGLLGLAFDPHFAANGNFYVNYTAPGGTTSGLQTVVSRFSVSPGNANKADSLSEMRLLTFDQPFPNHNGGMLAFGPDGYLYVGTGDGGSGNDPFNNGQSRTTLLGKILRIDIDTAQGYRIPPDNPYAGNTSGYRQEIWAYGLRNPWRFSFDPVTGTLWAGDVGQGTREEVDRIVKGGNFGWRIMEGFICRPGGGMCDTAGLLLPVVDYTHDQGTAITGGYVYRGSRRPDLVGRYIYSDFGSGNIWTIPDSTGPLTARLLDASGLAVSSFGVDRTNELYIVGYSPGAIYRFAQLAVSVDGQPANSTLPESPVLEQNYPNPFNPETGVRFQVSGDSKVTLVVYDVLGREVATLVNERKAPGSYEVRFDASGLASGVYVYCLTAGPFVQSRTMILIK